MSTETEAAAGAHFKNAVQPGPEERTPDSSRPSRQRRILWICLLGWTAFVGFALWWLFERNSGLSVWVFQERSLNQPGFSDKLQAIFRGEFGLQRVYPWILFSPFLALIAWYFPLERERLRRNLPLNVAACVAFIWACQALNLRTSGKRARVPVEVSDGALAPGIAPSAASDSVPAGGIGTADSFESDESGQFRRLRPLSPLRSRKLSLRSIILDLLGYGAITGLVHSVNFYARLRERERRALFLESNLAQARLNTLKAQLQPHFLFNSLNAITALLRRDPRLAETTLVSLSELLRLALSQSERQEGPLREELEFVERYLEIQQTRFGDKLRVEQEIEPEALDCLAPTLVLQPLVENAIRHGIERSERPGLLRVSASRQDGRLVLAVEDNGVGLAGSLAPPLNFLASHGLSTVSRAGTGIGLANLRERLQALYGSRQKLELTPRATGGVIVRVELPLQPRGPSEPANS